VEQVAGPDHDGNDKAWTSYHCSICGVGDISYKFAVDLAINLEWYRNHYNGIEIFSCHNRGIEIFYPSLIQTMALSCTVYIPIRSAFQLQLEKITLTQYFSDPVFNVGFPATSFLVLRLCSQLLHRNNGCSGLQYR
jgi:hypothetical protein